ncbi:MAG: serine hydrolase domain-containing protein [Leptospirillia bacterium]
MSNPKTDPVIEILRHGVDSGVFPGAVLWVGHHERELYHVAIGDAACLPQPLFLDRDTRFDLASLTKPMAVATPFMTLFAKRKISLETPLSQYFPEFSSTPDRARVTLGHLLTHASGLPAWRPLYEGAADADQVVARAAAEPLEHAPGECAVYSDLGFILLGRVLEKVTGSPLDRLFADTVCEPFGLTDTGFNRGNRPERYAGHSVAATADCPRRGMVLGVVHDDNAYAMDGVAGHAGLFGTARDVGRWAEGLVAAWNGRKAPLPQAIVRHFFSRDDSVSGSCRTLGFDTPAATPSGPSACGTHFGPATVGHLGFTGTSVWIDPEREWVVVLLTNRIHPDPENNRIRAFRPQLHETVAQALIHEPGPSHGG